MQVAATIPVLVSCTLFIVLTTPVRLVAQSAQPSGVRPGDRIRIATADLATERLARVLLASTDSLRIRYARNFGDGTVAWSGVKYLAVSEGPYSRALGARTGAKRGLVVGLIAGGVTALVAVVGCSGEVACIGGGTLVIAVPATLVLGGTLVGAGIGAAAPGERWRVVIR